MIVDNKSSKSPSSFFVKDLASLYILESLSVSTTWSKASLIFATWNLIALIISTRLSHRVADNDLKLKPLTLFFKIYHLFVELANNVHICCTTPKRSLALSQVFAMSQNAKLRLWQPCEGTMF